MRLLNEERLKRLRDRQLLFYVAQLEILALWTIYCKWPFPVKLAANASLILVALLWVLPSAPDLPAIALPLMWLTAFSFGFILAAGSPLKRPRAHWLRTVIDDEHEELWWE